jgi:hypothetical protein
MDAGHWNWLEVAKLTAGALTPVALAALGVYIHRVTKSFENLQWRSQKLIEKRLSVYDDLAPHFNDLLCYFTYIGCWKELDPSVVLALKRTMDKKIHIAAPLFSAAFFDACENFQNLCFETYGGWGRDAYFERNLSAESRLAPMIGRLSGMSTLVTRCQATTSSNLPFQRTRAGSAHR